MDKAIVVLNAGSSSLKFSALAVTPLVSVFTASTTHDGDAIAALARGQHDEGDDEPFHLIPESAPGKLGAILALLGFVIFMTGVLAGGRGLPAAGIIAVTGMLLVFAGGLLRVYAR